MTDVCLGTPKILEPEELYHTFNSNLWHGDKHDLYYSMEAYVGTKAVLRVQSTQVELMTLTFDFKLVGSDGSDSVFVTVTDSNGYSQTIDQVSAYIYQACCKMRNVKNCTKLLYYNSFLIMLL